MFYSIKNLDSTQIYQLMAQTIIPRPIAWIVTQNNGVTNIAPFSFFAPLSAKPATVVVSIGYKSDGTIKDTIANIQETKKCTICMVDEENLEKMHFSSEELDKSISEVAKFDIETKELFEGYPPMVKNATVAYSCSFNQLIDLGDAKTQPVVLNIHDIYINKNKEFKPVARIGREYAFLSQRIEAPQIK
jgi:flavin reductase (DIM6/NTAB) family NADH-FMN oxidoreductase RutF